MKVTFGGVGCPGPLAQPSPFQGLIHERREGLQPIGVSYVANPIRERLPVAIACPRTRNRGRATAHTLRWETTLTYLEHSQRT